MSRSDDQVTILLSDRELDLAEAVGWARQNWNADRGYHNAFGLGELDQSRDGNLNVQGAYGELAVAKFWDLYWLPLWDAHDRTRPDVGNLHVRSTKYPDGCLLLHDTDPDDGPFVCVVTADLPRCRIVGWKRAKHGKRQQFWRTDTNRPAYFVPQDQLWSVWTCPVSVTLGDRTA